MPRGVSSAARLRVAGLEDDDPALLVALTGLCGPRSERRPAAVLERDARPAGRRLEADLDLRRLGRLAARMPGQHEAARRLPDPDRAPARALAASRRLVELAAGARLEGAVGDLL